jgi:hypothetical protein
MKDFNALLDRQIVIEGQGHSWDEAYIEFNRSFSRCAFTGMTLVGIFRVPDPNRCCFGFCKELNSQCYLCYDFHGKKYVTPISEFAITGAYQSSVFRYKSYINDSVPYDPSNFRSK